MRGGNSAAVAVCHGGFASCSVQRPSNCSVLSLYSRELRGFEASSSRSRAPDTPDPGAHVAWSVLRMQYSDNKSRKKKRRCHYFSSCALLQIAGEQDDTRTSTSLRRTDIATHGIRRAHFTFLFVEARFTLSQKSMCILCQQTESKARHYFHACRNQRG